ncbi:MAG: hypothetical protein H6628_02195 [Calditrichae bacterium]|nr:hypothetical protein [Calditrichia bacterium]
MISLGIYPAALRLYSSATDVSGDGNVVVGWSRSTDNGWGSIPLVGRHDGWLRDAARVYLQ